MSEWKEHKLGEIISLHRGYDLPSSQRKKGTIPIVSSSGISDYHDSYKMLPPGVVTGRYGTIGEVFFLNEPYWPLNTTLYIDDFKGNDPLFIYYFLKSFDFEKFNDKSTIPGINRNHLYGEVVKIPTDIDEQKRIASILSSLDDKIDLLNRENATLEAMAETLFRQWFIEEAKEDWEERSLIDCIKLVGGGTPTTSNPNYWNGNIYWLSGGDIASNHKRFACASAKCISNVGLNNSSAKLLPEDAMVVSARGTVGKYCLLSKPMTFSQSNYGILPVFDKCYFFTYLLVAFHIEEIQNAAYGSVFDTITTKTFEGVMVKLPHIDEIIAFEKSISPYFEKMKQNEQQIRLISKQRDMLLPKLMSNEIRNEHYGSK